MDNYLDGGYHVPVLHKNLAGQLDLKQYRTEIYPKYSIQACDSGCGEGGVFSERYSEVDSRFILPST